MAGTDLLILIANAIKENVPGFKVKFKNESTFMKFLNVFVGLFNKNFMTGYVTTIGKTIYFPTKERYETDQVGSALVIAHEGVHLYDGKRYPILYEVSYLLPQVASVLALLAILAIWFSKLYLLFLIALLFLLPLPAYFRMKWEMRGYGMSLAVRSWYYEKPPVFGDHELRAFVSGDYFWMWPFKGNATNRLGEYVRAVRDGTICKEKVYRDVYNAVMKYKAETKGVKK